MAKYDILISQICFCFVFFPQWIQSDPTQFGPCNIHSWSIDCYSSGNYLKRESSCAFLMDCACLPLLYMDRELVWRSVILFSQSLLSALLFTGGRISPVFTPYFSSASRMTRLDDLESWWRWISLSLPSLFFSCETLVWRKTTTFSRQTFHVKYPLFPHPNLSMSLISCVFFTLCVLNYILLLQTRIAFYLFLFICCKLTCLMLLVYLFSLISNYILGFLWYMH